VLRLLDDATTPAAVCETFARRHEATLSMTVLTRFLTGLDDAGILAGERMPGSGAAGLQGGSTFYKRFKLFNPDRLFTRLVRPLGWVWSTEFFVCTALLMLATLLRALASWDELATYTGYILREHYLAVFMAGLLVGVTHEFAHGLTCKAFGGRATEVGALLIYYFLPALYCNVSGIHFIPKRSQRLWVIAAGIYWQLLAGGFALSAWFLLEPHTLAADLAFFFFLGSVLNLIFNANPLIKLDGYYFLSQWLRLPNLMDRSRAYWRSLLERFLFGERPSKASRSSARERAIYAAFGLLSFLYSAGLGGFIVLYAGGHLIGQFQLFGLALTAGLALFFLRRPLARSIASAARAFREDIMATETTKRWLRRRRLVPLALALAFACILLAPWSASVGNYGTLTALPDCEAIIRAPESATLVMLQVQPGSQLATGAVVGQMGNLELEEQLVAVQSDLARARANHDRLLGELRARGESVARAEVELRQSQREYHDADAEQHQIQRRRHSENGFGAAALVLTTDRRSEPAAARYPAALAVLQSEMELERARLVEANRHRDRARQLFSEGIVARSEMDAAETRFATLQSAQAAARERLEAALVEHRRRHASLASEVQRARATLGAERLEVEKLGAEVGAAGNLTQTLEERRRLLQRKRAQFKLVTPRAGTVFGEDLPRTVGQFFQKGSEICRVADTRQMLLRVNVPEREIGDIRVGHPVRLRVRAYPDRVFRGRVSKIGGESELGSYGQATYRVELMIENSDLSLRPGMTAFARVDFDRRMIARILLHKIKQALRPELWML
jgi:hypothetical protein